MSSILEGFLFKFLFNPTPLLYNKLFRAGCGTVRCNAVFAENAPLPGAPAEGAGGRGGPPEDP